MKKKGVVSIIVASALVLGAIGVSAAGTSKTIKVIMGGTSFTLNGNEATVSGAMTYNGKTYITVEEAAKLMDAQVTDAKGKVVVKTGPNRSLKYPSGEDIDAVVAKVSPVIKKSDEEFLLNGESYVAYNAVRKGTSGFILSLGKNFTTLDLSVLATAKAYSYINVYACDATGKYSSSQKLADYEINYPYPEIKKDISVDVTGLDYIIIKDGKSNLQLFNFSLTAK